MSLQTASKTMSRQIQLVSRPAGLPKESNFELVTAELDPIVEGEFLVKNEWMSVDPYMRGRMKDTDSYVQPFELHSAMEGGCIGQVVESKNVHFPEGSYVLGNMGWREHWTSDGEGVVVVDPQLAPVQTYLSALGMTGMTAWVGLRKIAKLKPGSTVFVSAASGAVGSIVCQIAKLNDCTVIGSAGKEEKIDWLRDKAKVDAVINYKTTNDLAEELGKLAPAGIDVYFDNVGGEHLEAAIENINDYGCCVECGMISTYNATEAPAAPRNLFRVIGKRIRMQGFIVRDHMADRDEFVGEMAAWIKSGKIVWEESVTDGLYRAPAAFIGLFKGDNLGKALIRIS